ncbi:peptidylprolyl isomerase [Methylococcus sp. EFPC2]|uniref:peptidylprolyl isomerase n=1 Tax=Methylococcus sp. EFPC2 TaxID=2812648 RepID=UPI001967594C|nr:peptidylprolyl isomerase [Methylococcus sp. EFPC2]QSA97966.1 peptidylprolyl isomerase [Methylococcus sp. EFPC2]
MKQSSLIAAAVASALLLAGCNNQGGGQSQTPGAGSKPAAVPAAPKPEDVVATVNGTPITKDAVAVMSAEIQQRRGPNGAPEDKVIEELISRELLRQEAVTQKLDVDPSYLARIDGMTRILLSQIAAEHFIKNTSVSDEEAKKEYESRIGAMKATEYRARHILVDNEATAKDIVAKLQKGAKFDELAKKLSKDPGSKEHGGELGWFSPQQMVQPFSEAVGKLKDGEVTPAPVQTQFGWHVIQREEVREQQPPAFDQVKDQIKNLLQTQKLQQHIADIKGAAKIERTAKKEEAPAAPPAPGAEDASKPAAPAGQAPAPAETQPSLEAGKPQAEKPADKPVSKPAAK